MKLEFTNVAHVNQEEKFPHGWYSSFVSSGATKINRNLLQTYTGFKTKDNLQLIVLIRVEEYAGCTRIIYQIWQGVVLKRVEDKGGIILFGPKEYEMVWYKKLNPILSFDKKTGIWTDITNETYYFNRDWQERGLVKKLCSRTGHINCYNHKLRGVSVSPEYTSQPFREPWIGIQRYLFVFPPMHGKLRIEHVRSKFVKEFLIQNGLSDKEFPMPTSEQISRARANKGRT